MLPNTLSWNKERKILTCLDQRVLPTKVEMVECCSYIDVVNAIKTMVVRGAPAIGAAAAYGMAIAAYDDISSLPKARELLAESRPTAVNLFWALERIDNVIIRNCDKTALAYEIEEEAENIFCFDIMINKRLSTYGQEIIPHNANVITHCNAGALATCGYGTALGVFRAARDNGKTVHIFVDETRPRLQGGRITAYEMDADGFDVTLITDSMAAYLMSKKKIDVVVTGADRIALNGDTANKIGTYSLAILAAHHGIPFYIAAPLSTFDVNCVCGQTIPIEERSGDEIRTINGHRVIPESIKVWNPAFDVTPSKLISGIITEYGIVTAPYVENIGKIIHKKGKYNPGEETKNGE